MRKIFTFLVAFELLLQRYYLFLPLSVFAFFLPCFPFPVKIALGNTAC